MTIKEIRKEFEHRINFSINAKTGLENYYRSEQKTFEELYINGTVTNFSSDFLAFANGYQITMNEYENLHILQTYDLHSINATKNVTRKMMMKFLNID